MADIEKSTRTTTPETTTGGGGGKTTTPGTTTTGGGGTEDKVKAVETAKAEVANLQTQLGRPQGR